jgi:hypothetical protein
MIVMAPHAPTPSRQPVSITNVVDTPLPDQDCMNSVAGADGYAPPTQDCLTSIS